MEEALGGSRYTSGGRGVEPARHRTGEQPGVAVVIGSVLNSWVDRVGVELEAEMECRPPRA